MRIRWFCLAILIAGIGIGGCRGKRTSPEQIRAFVEEFEQSTEVLERQEILNSWEFCTQGYSDSLGYYRNLHRRFVSQPSWYLLSKEYLEETQDASLRARLETINRRSARFVVDGAMPLAGIIDSLAATRQHLQPVFEGKPVSAAEVMTVLGTDSSRYRRQEAWQSLMAVGDQMAGSVAFLARQRNRAAGRIGFLSYYDLMLSADGLDKSAYLGWLQEWNRLTMEPYRRGLESLRANLGIEDVRPWDIEYIRNADDRTLAMYYPAEAAMPRLKGTMNGLGINLDDWPIYFSPQVAPDIVHADGVFRVHPPDDIRVVFETGSGPAALKRLFAQAGRALYIMHSLASDNPSLRPPANAYEEGMARLLGGMVTLDDWERKYAAVPDSTLAAMAARRQFVYLYDIRLILVDLLFEYEMYKNPTIDLHQVYRELYERHLLMPYPEDLKGWGAQPAFIDNPVGLQNELIGAGIAAHVYHYLMGRQGAVVDLPVTGEFLLQNFYSPVSNESWEQLLVRVTGEKFNPQYLLELSGL